RSGRGTLRTAAPGGPMDLIEVDHVDLQPLETRLGFPANGRGLEVVRNFSGFIPDKAALGEGIRARTKLLDSAADDHLRVPQPVGRCGINPIHAVIQARMDRGDGFAVILRAPSEFPLSSPNGPGSNPNRRNPQVALSER